MDGDIGTLSPYIGFPVHFHPCKQTWQDHTNSGAWRYATYLLLTRENF
jgi:hypothetical protein